MAMSFATMPFSVMRREPPRARRSDALDCTDAHRHPSLGGRLYRMCSPPFHTCYLHVTFPSATRYLHARQCLARQYRGTYYVPASSIGPSLAPRAGQYRWVRGCRGVCNTPIVPALHSPKGPCYTRTQSTNKGKREEHCNRGPTNDVGTQE